MSLYAEILGPILGVFVVGGIISGVAITVTLLISSNINKTMDIFSLNDLEEKRYYLNYFAMYVNKNLFYFILTMHDYLKKYTILTDKQMLNLYNLIMKDPSLREMSIKDMDKNDKFKSFIDSCVSENKNKTYEKKDLFRIEYVIKDDIINDDDIKVNHAWYNNNFEYGDIKNQDIIY